ncbi:exported hypothetical protein [Novosphingobium sp. KN65.2]|nr:exported hypothetical protein [Novosphingobium sp. KN65.2]
MRPICSGMMTGAGGGVGVGAGDGVGVEETPPLPPPHPASAAHAVESAKANASGTCLILPLSTFGGHRCASPPHSSRTRRCPSPRPNVWRNRQPAHVRRGRSVGKMPRPHASWVIPAASLKCPQGAIKSGRSE